MLSRIYFPFHFTPTPVDFHSHLTLPFADPLLIWKQWWTLMLARQVTLFLSCWLNLDFGWEKCAQHQGRIGIGPRQSRRYCSWQRSCDWAVRGNLCGEFEEDFPIVKRESRPREQMYGRQEAKGVSWKVEADTHTPGSLLLFGSWVVPDSFGAPWAVALQAPLSMGFPRQEHWSGLPFRSPGDLPNPGTEPESPAL